MKKIAVLAVLLFVSTIAFADDVDEKRYDALGETNYTLLYMTYVSLGVLGDAFGNNVYKSRRVKTITRGLVTKLRRMRTIVRKLIRMNGIEENDLPIARKIARCYTLLIRQGRSLIRFASTRSRAYANRYDRFRKRAWKIIESLNK